MGLSSLDSNTGRLVLRLSVGGMMLFHGIAKVLHPGSLDFISGMLTGHGLPTFIAYGVYIGEILAPLMVVAGIHSRLGGLLIAVNMLFAIILAHSGDILSLSEHGGWAIELQMFYFLSAVAVMFLGSGRFAVKPD